MVSDLMFFPLSLSVHHAPENAHIVALTPLGHEWLGAYQRAYSHTTTLHLRTSQHWTSSQGEQRLVYLAAQADGMGCEEYRPPADRIQALTYLIAKETL